MSSRASLKPPSYRYVNASSRLCSSPSGATNCRLGTRSCASLRPSTVPMHKVSVLVCFDDAMPPAESSFITSGERTDATSRYFGLSSLLLCSHPVVRTANAGRAPHLAAANRFHLDKLEMARDVVLMCNCPADRAGRFDLWLIVAVPNQHATRRGARRGEVRKTGIPVF